MDDEQRKYFATLLDSMEGVASDARAAASTSRETAATVRKLDGRVGVLEKHVFGSEPPPSPPARPMSESISEHGGDIAEMAGQLLAVKAEVQTIKQETAKQTAILERLDKVAANPMVRRIAYLVGLAVTAWLASKGFK